MNKVKIIIILFFCSVFATVNAGSRYRYVCDDGSCYNTKVGYIDEYYLYPVEQTRISNFSDFIDEELESYSDYYDDNEIIIEGFCTGSCDSVQNNELTLNELFLIQEEFYIGEETWFGLGDINITDTYSSGKDYFLSNISSIIDDLHVGFPWGDKKDSLSDISSNILSYNNNELNIKNVCEYSTGWWCGNSNQTKIGIDDTSAYKLLSGTIKRNIYFRDDTFIVSNDYNISDLFLKAGNSLDFNFGFEDYLDYSSNNTNYEYRIYYNYDGEGTPAYDDYFLKETIKINNYNFSVSSPNIASDIIGDIIDIDVLDEDFKKIRVGVSEGINLTKSGKINFYLSAKNINTGDKFDIKMINSIPVTVLPNDNVTNGVSEITSSFNPTLNSENVGFNIGDTFSVKLNLKDEFGNEHYDYISGYDISLSSGSSEFIELSKYGSSDFSKTLSSVETTDSDNPYSIVFKFRVTETGYHDFNGFDIKVRSKLDKNYYNEPASYYTLKNVIPTNLYDGAQKMKIFIKTPTYSELQVTCGQTVRLGYTCTSDNFSGCNSDGDSSVLYTNTSDNGTQDTLSIIDYAYNTKNFTYTMNHVDKIAPQISLFKGINNLYLNNYNYKANSDSLKIKFYEWSTDNCDKVVNYDIKLNGVDYMSGTKNGSNSEVDLFDIFKTSGNTELYIKVTDKYGNFTEKTINFIIYPNIVDTSNTSIVVIGKDSKYANYSDEYDYKLLLKDIYDNPIYNKQVKYLNTDCGNVTGCNVIYTDMINESGEDAIIEDISNWTTDINGTINFKLKSYTPGIFTEKFSIKINNWNDSYEDTFLEETFNVGNIGDLNSFKKPFIGELLVSSNTGSVFHSIPEIGTMQKYKINMYLNTGLSYTNGSLKILSNSSITNSVSGHVFENFGNTYNDFGNDFTNYLGFTTRINAQTNVLKAPLIKSNDLEIGYILNSKNIKYVLSENEDCYNPISLELGGEDQSSLGVKIVGSYQLDGKASITGQEENFSDTSNSVIRGKLKKNIYTLIKGASSGQVVNGIKYIKGDYEINSSSVIDYETIVIEDGNLFIGGNINNTIGIFVLNNNLLDLSIGNVYIKNNVNYIDAIIYTDGGLISTNTSGTPYTTDDYTRTSELQKQLILKGTLFTKNTIGGAVLGTSGKYLLPLGVETDNFNKAMVYDLNYVRRGSMGCEDSDIDGICDIYSDYFIIIYNPEIQTSPPKGFTSY